MPGLITMTTLLLDIYRRELPCGAITPRIGRVKCFFSGEFPIIEKFNFKHPK